MRAVVDTDVIVSALLWNGTPGEVLALARDGRIRIHASKALLDELREVLRRPKFAERLKRTGRTAKALIRDYSQLALLVRNRQPTTRVSRDADDDALRALSEDYRAMVDDRLLLDDAPSVDRLIEDYKAIQERANAAAGLFTIRLLAQRDRIRTHEHFHAQVPRPVPGTGSNDSGSRDGREGISFYEGSPRVKSPVAVFVFTVYWSCSFL